MGNFLGAAVQELEFDSAETQDWPFEYNVVNGKQRWGFAQLWAKSGVKKYLREADKQKGTSCALNRFYLRKSLCFCKSHERLYLCVPRVSNCVHRRILWHIPRQSYILLCIAPCAVPNEWRKLFYLHVPILQEICNLQAFPRHVAYERFGNCSSELVLFLLGNAQKERTPKKRWPLLRKAMNSSLMCAFPGLVAVQCYVYILVMFNFF